MNAQKAVVIGGAITGPSAAIAFQKAGWEVECHEARPVATTTSAGVLGLRPWVLNTLADLGISRQAIVPHETGDTRRHFVAGRRVIEAKDGQLPSRKVPWHLLHDALDRQFGRIQYESKITEPPDATLVVWADGVGSAGRKRLDPGRTFRPGGYAAFRGITTVAPEYFDWAVFEDDQHFLMNVTPTLTAGGEDRIEWTVFFPWPADKGLMHYIPCLCSSAIETEFRAVARTLLPQRLVDFIDATDESGIAATAIGDWDVPTQMVFGNEIILGDAVCGMRPHTAMGANLGIGEACSLPRAYAQGDLDMWQAEWLGAIAEQHDRGARMGAHYELNLAGDQT